MGAENLTGLLTAVVVFLGTYLRSMLTIRRLRHRIAEAEERIEIHEECIRRGVSGGGMLRIAREVRGEKHRGS